MKPAVTIENLWRRSVPYSRSAAYVVCVSVAAAFFYHIGRHSPAYYGLLEDDHFYYTVVADNFVSTGRLTYDGATSTNGFHPLWFATVVLVRALTGSLGPSFYVVLTLVALAAMIATYELSRRYAQLLGASAPWAAAAAALYSLATARLLATGMECVLAVPLLLWWLIEIALPAALTPRRAAFLGLLSSLAVLARLDIAIAVALAMVAHLVWVKTPWPLLWRRLAAFCAGGALLPVYLAVNVAFFGSLMPVSALAKRMTTAKGFNFSYPWNIAWHTNFGPTVGLVLPLGLLAAFLLYRRGGRLPSRALASAGVALSFAAIFFCLNSLSGWLVFGWYLYPLPAALLAALILISRRWPLSAALRPAGVISTLLLITATSAASVLYFLEHGPKWSVADNSMLAMSYELADRTKKYDGLFAMGAIAGMARLAMDRPILQIEGIISDQEMVRHVRDQDHLGEVLRAHGVDYLIASYAAKHPPTLNDCVLVQQPDEQWAGKRTAKMSGWICGTPAEHFITQAGGHTYSEFPQLETFVWDLRHVTWK